MQHFEPHSGANWWAFYSQAASVNTQVEANDIASFKLIALTHRVQLEPAVRYAVIEKLEELSGPVRVFGQQLWAADLFNTKCRNASASRRR
jgi:hypothetical protein